MKNDIREEYKNIRKNVIDKDNKSKIITNKIIDLKEYKDSKIIALYKNLNSEVNTEYLIDYSLKNNKIVYLPKVIGNDLVFYKTNNLDFEKSDFGIEEPISNEIIESDKIDLFIIPGICFDKYKNRIGFGKGYYDRVKYNKKAIKIGICFDEQLYQNRIKTDEFDIKMDKVITNKKII